MKLKELTTDKPFKAYLYIKDSSVRTSKNGSQFIKLALGDTAFDEVTAYLWNAKEEDIEDYKQGRIVGVLGKGKEYQGSMQLDVQRIRLANEGDDVDISRFIETAPYPSQDMYDELVQTARAFSNEDMKKLTLALLENKEEQLDYFPAAKSFHHALRGGLLYHTVSMLRIGKSLAKLYPFINSDLLYAGIILHDIGKVDEMQSDEAGSVCDYTPSGKLLGHITTEITEIDRFGRKLGIDPEVLLLLEHMVLSHHYEPEYGSPVRPMFPEAELLHHIDVIDARMNAMRKAQERLKPGEFSDKIFSLDGTRLYKPKL